AANSRKRNIEGLEANTQVNTYPSTTREEVSICHNSWFDAKARSMFIITPKRHVERLSDCCIYPWSDENSKYFERYRLILFVEAMSRFLLTLSSFNIQNGFQNSIPVFQLMLKVAEDYKLIEFI
ncbi:1574_t:CDS:2, partial [Funneliformis caledonium]